MEKHNSKEPLWGPEQFGIIEYILHCVGVNYDIWLGIVSMLRSPETTKANQKIINRGLYHIFVLLGVASQGRRTQLGPLGHYIGSRTDGRSMDAHLSLYIHWRYKIFYPLPSGLILRPTYAAGRRIGVIISRIVPSHFVGARAPFPSVLESCTYHDSLFPWLPASSCRNFVTVLCFSASIASSRLPATVTPLRADQPIHSLSGSGHYC